jgi:hypothetical protein
MLDDPLTPSLASWWKNALDAYLVIAQRFNEFMLRLECRCCWLSLFIFVVGSLAADMNKLNKDVRDSSQVLVTPTHDLFSIPPRCLLRLAMS